MNDASVRLTVDRDRCMGSGVCSFHAPSTFDLDASCKAFVVAIADPIDSIRSAVESCPQRAITISEGERA